MVGGHYHDKIFRSSGLGKCTFDIEKYSHIRDFSQSKRRKNTFLTSSGSYWDSSTWIYLEFEPKNWEDNCETSNAERRALNTHTGHFTVIISERFHFFVVLELQWSMRLICYIFNPLNTEFRSRKKKRIFFPTSPFWIGFPPVLSMEMAKNEIFSYCLFCFWNGNCWLCWGLFINGLFIVCIVFIFFTLKGRVTWTPIPPFFRA